VCLVLGNNASLRFLVIQFATIELREPQLDEVSRNAVGALRIAPSNDAVSDILAKLQFERRRTPAIWPSGFHEPSAIEARRVSVFPCPVVQREGFTPTPGHEWMPPFMQAVLRTILDV
jgi:hypothetical protein